MIALYDPSKNATENAFQIARDARLRLKYILEQPPFSLVEAAGECYRLIAAGALLLSTKNRDSVISACYFQIEAMGIDLMDVNDRSPGRYTHAFQFALMPFFRFANKRLRLKFPDGTEDVIDALLSDHSHAYFAADPDINPSWMTRMLWDLFDAIIEQDPIKVVQKITSITDELNSVEQPHTFRHYELDRSVITPTDEPVSTLRISEVKRVALLSTDQTPRINRLAARLSALKAAGGPVAQIERIEQELRYLLGEPSGIDPSRLYPDGFPDSHQMRVSCPDYSPTN